MNHLHNSPPLATQSTESAGYRIPQPPAPMLDPAGQIQSYVVPRLIPIERMREILGLKNAAIHAKVAAGELPAPIKFGVSRRAAARWIEQEIVEFVAAKAAERRQPCAA